jgi:hypothetical protein
MMGYTNDAPAPVTSAANALAAKVVAMATVAIRNLRVLSTDGLLERNGGRAPLRAHSITVR